MHILTVNGKLNQYSPKPMHLISDVHSTDGCQHPQLRDRITLLHVGYHTYDHSIMEFTGRRGDIFTVQCGNV